VDQNTIMSVMHGHCKARPMATYQALEHQRRPFH